MAKRISKIDSLLTSKANNVRVPRSLLHSLLLLTLVTHLLRHRYELRLPKSQECRESEHEKKIARLPGWDGLLLVRNLLGMSDGVHVNQYRSINRTASMVKCDQLIAIIWAIGNGGEMSENTEGFHINPPRRLRQAYLTSRHRPNLKIIPNQKMWR
jgi:hypothetical protein